MATILITHGIPAEGFDVLAGHTLIIPPPLKAFTLEELRLHIENADAVVACGKLPGDIISAGKNVRIIANYGAGYDSVDIATAARCGIPVTNIPQTVTHSTAELAIALMLAVSRRIGELNLRLRREPAASLFGMGLHMGRSVQGQTLGIIGCGRIGVQVAHIAKALGMRVLGYDPMEANPAIFTPCALDVLLREADVVSLHCPLTETTRGLMDKKAFAQMKKGAVLINTARGPIIDTAAFVEAITQERLAGAGLDVYPDEPHIPESLLQSDRVVCTPHIGANTEQTRLEMARACAKQIMAVFAGERPENIVNGL